MNDGDYPNDTILTQELRDSVSALAAPVRPPLAAITSRGRAHQRRRRAGFAGLGVTSVAAGIALAIGLAGAPATTPAGSTGTIRSGAFTLTSNANGTDTLTLTDSQMFDPAALQRALAEHGIPALVKTGTFCSSNPSPPDPHAIGVLSIRPPIKPPRAALVPAPGEANPGSLSRIIDRTVTVINPAAMPSGTELFFGYASDAHLLFVDLIYPSSFICSGQPPLGP